VDALIGGIKDGTVDAIATDHAPHTREDKLKGSPGLSGLETSFSVAHTVLVRDNNVDLKLLSRLMSGRPAEIMGLDKGKLIEGYDGDMVLIDLERRVVVDPSSFVSKGKNTPFEGHELQLDFLMSIKRGDI
jgi:dihydroorotase